MAVPLTRAQQCKKQLGDRIQAALCNEQKWPMQHQIRGAATPLCALMDDVDRLDCFSPIERAWLLMLCNELMLPHEQQMPTVLEYLCNELWSDERVHGVLVLYQYAV
jgi:hypothetical protein